MSSIGPSRLSKILKRLRAEPKPVLEPSLKSLKLVYAARNDHFGARHFIRSDLPRIQYNNPAIVIEVNKVPKSEADTWQSSLSMEFDDGSKKSFTMDRKWSSAIFADLMDAAGTPAWDEWKAERRAANLPIVHSPPKPSKPSSSTTKKTGAAAVLP